MSFCVKLDNTILCTSLICATSLMVAKAFALSTEMEDVKALASLSLLLSASLSLLH